MEKIIELINKGYSVKFEDHPFYDNAINIVMSKGHLHKSHAILNPETCLLSVTAQIYQVLDILERCFENDQT